MAITPLYTQAEIDAEIIQAKQDLATARRALFRQVDTGGGTGRRVQQDNVKALQQHLDWLQQQRVALQTGDGPQSNIGRPIR